MTTFDGYEAQFINCSKMTIYMVVTHDLRYRLSPVYSVMWRLSNVYVIQTGFTDNEIVKLFFRS